jgi:outer membrane murein-binding lipoprotein Lpp
MKKLFVVALAVGSVALASCANYAKTHAQKYATEKFLL